MSNRPCNFCEYQALIRKYGSERLTLKSAGGSLGGTNVYLDGKFVAWYMELPDHCAC